LNPIQNQPKQWSQQQLTDIRKLIDGDDLFQSLSEEVAPDNGLNDVLILAPSGSELLSSNEINMGQSLADQGVDVKAQVGKVGYTAQVTDQKLDGLKEMGYTVVDDSPRNLVPSLPQMNRFASATWTIPNVNAVTMTKSDQMHAQGATGKGEVVAILDSGFDVPALADHVAVYNDFAEGNTEFRDGAGHGSYVAQGVLSTAPDAKLAIGRVMGDKGTGRPSDILKGLQWVEELRGHGMNISVVNLSLGGQSSEAPELMKAIHDEIDKLSSQGVKVVAAAGNNGPSAGTLASPADAAGAIAVGSALNPDVVSSFSGRGEQGSNRPDLVAPGEYIQASPPAYSEMYRTAFGIQKLRDMEASKLQSFVQARPQLLTAFGLSQDLLDATPQKFERELKASLPPTGIINNNVAAPGTSFAAPLASGVLASLDSLKDLSSEEARQVLRSSADPVQGYKPNEQGAGFLDAAKAYLEVRASMKSVS
jgi:hypothetical protein